MKCMNISEVKSEFHKYDVIAIDEGQFFPDVYTIAMTITNFF